VTLPLHGAISDEPYLGPRLLKRALVVVQFSPVLKIAEKSGAGIGEFQDAVRRAYPQVELEVEKLMQLEVRPDGIHPSEQEQPVWRMSDIDKAWLLSLTSQTIALETSGSTYSNWADFSDRIQFLIRRVGDFFAPAQKVRSGVRFLNLAAVDGGDDPRAICEQSLVSISGNPDLIQSDLLWRFGVDEGTLILRSGVVEANNTHDPGIMPPSSERSWYLDIDVFNNDAAAFDADAICQALLGQVRRVHAIYRWAIPDENGKR
jgi:uncharacterized protein (TIGR04255 family)